MTPDDVAVLLGASADAAHFVGEVAGRGGDVKKYLPCWERFVSRDSAGNKSGGDVNN